MEKLCTETASVLTFPKGNQLTELLRVTNHGQVIFNYKDWHINSATDLLFRAIADEAPALCAPYAQEQNKQLAQCKSKVESIQVMKDDYKAQTVQLTAMNQALAENITRGDALFWLFMGMVMGSILASLMTAYIMHQRSGE